MERVFFVWFCLFVFFSLLLPCDTDLKLLGWKTSVLQGSVNTEEAVMLLNLLQQISLVMSAWKS